MPKRPIIYPLNQSHIQQVADIEQHAHISPWSEQTIALSFGPRSHNFGMFIKSGSFDELVGYCFTDLVAGELSIENICITPIMQNKGLGKLLLSHVIDTAKQLKVYDILLEVRSSNKSAIKLYQAFGFSECGRRKAYYDTPLSALTNFNSSSTKEDAIVMKLSIN